MTIIPSERNFIIDLIHCYKQFVVQIIRYYRHFISLFLFPTEFTPCWLFFQSCRFIHPSRSFASTIPPVSSLSLSNESGERGHGARTSRSGEADRTITRIEVLPSVSNKMHIIARVRSNTRSNIVRLRRYDPSEHIYTLGIRRARRGEGRQGRGLSLVQQLEIFFSSDFVFYFFRT